MRGNGRAAWLHIKLGSRHMHTALFAWMDATARGCSMPLLQMLPEYCRVVEIMPLICQYDIPMLPLLSGIVATLQ